VISNRLIKELRQRLNVSRSVAEELLTLAGGDVELAVQASSESSGLTQCKARIIDERFKKLES
jgi:hypothetical protein